ncbi:MAG: hypothetical protein WD690_09455 [Vicinamibacterales bacterium]
MDKFDADLTALARKPKITRAEFDAARSRANAFKREFVAAQATIISVITKWKQGGRWTPELDKMLMDRIRGTAPAEAVQTINAAGGIRNLFNRVAAPAATAEFGKELDAVIRELQPKSALERWFESLSGTPVYAGYFGVYGRAAKVVLKVLTWACDQVC